MKHVVIGAGQVGSALVRELTARGDEVVVIRRSPVAVRGVRVVTGDVLDDKMLAKEVASAVAVHHCIHAPYDHRVWRRELPARELVVMNVAAKVGVPVIFPESVYAFGRQAADLHEGADVAPSTPLGQVRAELLHARARHEAGTASLVASDLFGPTASGGSVATSMMFGPVSRGKRAWVPAALEAMHSWTYLPDLARAMIHAAEHFDELCRSSSSGRDLVLHAPTGEARSCRQIVRDAGSVLGRPARIATVPEWTLAAVGRVNPMVRELHAQRYLWRDQAVLRPGRLSVVDGLQPTPWDTALRESLVALS